MSTPGKPRVLYVAKILHEETDADHALSLPEIQARLDDFGISSERKSLYRDFDALKELGVTLGRTHTRPVRYYLEERTFEPMQMTLLVDAVQTSKSITKTNSTTLIRRLKRLMSKHDGKRMDARIHVTGRVKTQNESIFTTLDIIQQAIAEKRDIAFDYMRYDVNMKLCDFGNPEGSSDRKRVKTPLFLVYSNNSYYMLAFDEGSEDGLRNYRADRMYNVMLRDKSDESHKAAPGFRIEDYERQVLEMYDGSPTPITMLVAERLVGSIVDMFGIENTSSSEATPKMLEEAGINPVPDGRWAAMRVKAVPSPVLFGRIAQFGGDVVITHPKPVVAAYTDCLKAALRAQGCATQ